MTKSREFLSNQSVSFEERLELEVKKYEREVSPESIAMVMSLSREQLEWILRSLIQMNHHSNELGNKIELLKKVILKKEIEEKIYSPKDVEKILRFGEEQ